MAQGLQLYKGLWIGPNVVGGVSDFDNFRAIADRFLSHERRCRR